jgi:dipeptide/tripeptide permease
MNGAHPVNLSATQQLNPIWIIIIFAIAVYCLKYFRLSRDSVWNSIAALGTGIVAFAVTMAILKNNAMDQATKAIIAAIAAMIIYALYPKRSRKIPRSTKKAVISRDLGSKRD